VVVFWCGSDNQATPQRTTLLVDSVNWCANGGSCYNPPFRRRGAPSADGVHRRTSGRFQSSREFLKAPSTFRLLTVVRKHRDLSSFRSIAPFTAFYATCMLHVYLHREPHSSGPFDMQLVYEDMPQESGSYQSSSSYQCKRICKRI